jgi:hypothetical protein
MGSLGGEGDDRNKRRPSVEPQQLNFHHMSLHEGPEPDGGHAQG